MEEGYPPLPEGMKWVAVAGDINVIRTTRTPKGQLGCVAWWSEKENSACIKKRTRDFWVTEKTPVENQQQGLQYISAYFMLGMENNHDG